MLILIANFPSPAKKIAQLRHSREKKKSVKKKEKEKA
jgi:hypothetical protein